MNPDSATSNPTPPPIPNDLGPAQDPQQQVSVVNPPAQIAQNSGSNKMLMIIIGVIVLLLLAAGGGYYYMTQVNIAPTQSIQTINPIQPQAQASPSPDNLQNDANSVDVGSVDQDFQQVDQNTSQLK